MSMPDDVPIIGTVKLEPNWSNVRLWVENIYRSEPDRARHIAETMGCEAPNLAGMACCPNCGRRGTETHMDGCPVGEREQVS